MASRKLGLASPAASYAVKHAQPARASKDRTQQPAGRVAHDGQADANILIVVKRAGLRQLVERAVGGLAKDGRKAKAS